MDKVFSENIFICLARNLPSTKRPSRFCGGKHVIRSCYTLHQSPFFFHNMNLASVRIPLKINDSLVYSRMRNLSIVLGEFYLHSIMHNALVFEHSRLDVVCTFLVLHMWQAQNREKYLHFKFLVGLKLNLR